MPSELSFPEARRRFFVQNPPKPPSSEGNAEKFRAAQKKDAGRIYCGRPVTNDLPVPASLMDAILCEFQHNLIHCVPSTADVLCFRELRREMTATFENEGERRDKLVEILARLAPTTASLLGPKAITGTSYTTDGDLRALNDRAEFLYFVQAVKNEVGTGGAEPYFEGIHYWLEQIRSCIHTIPPGQQRQVNFPAIILTHTGK